jgi:hypothetical protein
MLPSSGAITLDALNAEINAASGTSRSMNEAWIRTMAGYPTTGAEYGMGSLYGKGMQSTTPGGFATSEVTAPNSAFAQMAVGGDGVITSTAGTSGSSGLWFAGAVAGIGSYYEVYCEHVSGATPSGTLNAWFAVGAGAYWGLSRGTNGVSTCTLRIYLRNAYIAQSSPGTWTLTASREP